MGFIWFGGKYVDQGYIPFTQTVSSWGCIIKFYMEEFTVIQEITLGGLGLILLFPSHFMEHTLSKLYKWIFDIGVCHNRNHFLSDISFPSLPLSPTRIAHSLPPIWNTVPLKSVFGNDVAWFYSALTFFTYCFSEKCLIHMNATGGHQRMWWFLFMVNANPLTIW